MTYRDEFDEPRSGGFLNRVGPKAAFLIVLIALFFMIGVVLKLYMGSGDDQGQSVPIVRADDNPYKVTPDDPGGMEIPHKDSTIFSTLKASRDDESKIENLLAEDENEEPMPRSQLFAGLNTEANPDLNAQAQPSPLDQPLNAESKTEVSPDPVELAPDVVIIDPVPEKVVVSEPAPVKSEPAPAPTPVKSEPAPVAVSSGDYYIQLASVKTADGAESEWKKLLSKYTALSGYSHRVEKADLGDKGIFYRIQAGPVNKDQATSTCDAIKKITPGGCLVKKN